MFRKTKDIPDPKDAILKYLEGIEESSTDKISKKLGMAWSTANIHCLKLKTENKITNKVKYQGYKKRIMWSIKS